MSKLRVFVSWAGEASKGFASELKDWLPKVLQATQVFMSEEIAKGTRGLSVISQELEESDFGIICLTPENVNSPWILFEAGALSKKVEEARVGTYLLAGLEDSAVRPPLSQFQSTKPTKVDTLRLLHSINEKTGSMRLSDGAMQDILEKFWDELEAAINLARSQNAAVPPKPQPEEMLAEILQWTRAQSRFSRPRWAYDTLVEEMARRNRVNAPPSLARTVAAFRLGLHLEQESDKLSDEEKQTILDLMNLMDPSRTQVDSTAAYNTAVAATLLSRTSGSPQLCTDLSDALRMVIPTFVLAQIETEISSGQRDNFDRQGNSKA